MVGKRIGRLALLCAAVLAVMAGPPASAAPAPCRVRNVTQDTRGDSLKRMAREAHDGDRLRVRGTCPGQMVVDADITLIGKGDRPTLTGRGRTRVLRVTESASVIVRRLTITRGVRPDVGTRDGGLGGGVVNAGALTLRNVRVIGNAAQGRWGMSGGIHNVGRLRLLGSVVRGNEAGASAGGVFNRRRMVIEGSVIVGNATLVQHGQANGGGGILNFGRLRIVDSRVTGNRSLDFAGGIHTAGRVRLVRTTIARNRAGTGGGVVASGLLTALESRISDNRAGFGGGIQGYGRVVLTRTAVSGNRARQGAGISSWGTLALNATTVTENAARREGGGIWNGDGGTVTLDSDSSVTGNTPDDCVPPSVC